MSIVARGLGQPEDGPIVAGGLGSNGGAPSGSFRNMAATITATASLTATLETSGTPEPPPAQTVTGGTFRRHPRQAPILVSMSAVITCTSSMSATAETSMNFDADLEQLLLISL